MSITIDYFRDKNWNENSKPRYLTKVTKVVWDWTSDSAGDATETTEIPIAGLSMRVVAIADATDTPTDDYDLTITDENGQDILEGKGTDLPNGDGADEDNVKSVVTDVSSSGVPVALKDELTFTIANAGDTNKGQVVLYLQ